MGFRSYKIPGLVTVLISCTVTGWGMPRYSNEPSGGRWGDQGDGSYCNPILPADYSDIDAIRVGDDYYCVSSTFQFSPGVVILKSKDLVNWKIIGHAVPDVTQIDPKMNWDSMSEYGNGIWAGALRFHDGLYWVYFGTPSEGYFMTTAKDPSGPWAPLTRLMASGGWDDCCPFWDDDGQGYLVGSRFNNDPADGKRYNIHLFKLTPDGKALVPGFDRIIHQSEGSEANKLYKINGLYYHLFSHVTPEGRVVMMGRSSSLEGPWELQQLQHGGAREPNQGGLVQTPSGEWWWLTHMGQGSWDGRIMNLLPVHWKDGWPILGEPAEDGPGLMVWRNRKPIASKTNSSQLFQDTFDKTVLAPSWEWNYQPRSDKWSLTENPGSLRLHAFKPLRPYDGLFSVGNILTQRPIRTNHSMVTVRMNVSAMQDGQRAGLCHFAGNWHYLGVIQEIGKRHIIFQQGDPKSSLPSTEQLGEEMQQNVIWLRSEWGQQGESSYSYSLDGSRFIPFGPTAALTSGNYRGDRVGLFTYNRMREKGSVDFDFFEQVVDGPPGGGKSFESHSPSGS